MNSSALESRDHGLEITTLMIHQSAAHGSGVLHQEASTSNSTDPPPPPVRVKLFAQYSLLRSTRVTGSPSTQWENICRCTVVTLIPPGTGMPEEQTSTRLVVWTYIKSSQCASVKLTCGTSFQSRWTYYIRNGLFDVAASAGLCTIRNNAKNIVFMLKHLTCPITAAEWPTTFWRQLLKCKLLFSMTVCRVKVWCIVSSLACKIMLTTIGIGTILALGTICTYTCTA